VTIILKTILSTRLTGLDPANWETQPTIYENPLMPSDAVFVDTIQTDGFFIGTRTPFGHVTFLPNNADVQPGCPSYRHDNIYNYISYKLQTVKV